MWLRESLKQCKNGTTIPESQDSVLGPFSKIMVRQSRYSSSWSAYLAIVSQERPEESICTTASDGTSDGSDESEAVQLKLLRQQMYSKN